MKHVSPKQFFNGQKLNRLNKDFESLDVNSWDGVNIYLKHTHFAQVDAARGRRNNVSSVVQLQESLIECSGVHFEKSRRGYTRLFVKSSVKRAHDFGSELNVLLVYKDSKGRKDSIRLHRTWKREDFKGDLVGYKTIKNERLEGKSWGVRHRYERMVRTRMESLLYEDMHDLERGRIDDSLKTAFSKFGITLIKAVPYTFEFWMHGVQFIKTKGLNFKIGRENTSTYCSLPDVLEIQVRKKEIEFIPLAKIGVEKSGYYDHSESLSIRPEHLSAVKAFKSKFNRETKGA